jgi:hypothetical protein
VAKSPSDRRTEPERRGANERRGGRAGPRGFVLRLLHGERRQKEERRYGNRRSVQQTAIDLVRGACDQIAALRQGGSHLDDAARQRLDAAFVRLRFAVERLESGTR